MSNENSEIRNKETIWETEENTNGSLGVVNGSPIICEAVSGFLSASGNEFSNLLLESKKIILWLQIWINV
jgi:hypothetical protein